MILKNGKILIGEELVEKDIRIEGDTEEQTIIIEVIIKNKEVQTNGN